MAVKGLVAAIVQFLTQQLQEGDITEESRESLEVAIQCLESAYNVQASDTPANFNLYEIYKSTAEKDKPPVAAESTAQAKVTPQAKAEAERLKNEGNNFMKADKHIEALLNYTKAIELDGHNAVYYCNRAAAYSKIGNHQQAIKNCLTALSIDPSYSKAYGRLGLAYSSMEKHKEAKESYQKALEMEPDNESYKNNLKVAEEKLAQQGTSNTGLGGGAFPGNDLSSLLSNPALMNMARHMLTNPALQNMVSNFMVGQVEQGGPMDALIEAQQFARQLHNANPELIESLRRQMGGNSNDPDPPQEN
ncbi:PREDICTED: small glutamine-rich tetratricopeptide repeat-containing protein alpha-like isoform X2 [Habropoda laboriosa]|uniref:small glutamine-rich tetratricopeptide repeat-containing protein alpha-like isoform X2 n=1 Tax=Habropoda laboriosa TaxID=597456 RepID=UPI00083DDD5A|nr:PREDICTED: small glutamine-rich tetratricopeptide repeat-containing protein alpha-like isoform X2 [Habropoda laboriosa]